LHTAATHPAYAAGICFADWFARSLRDTARFPVGIINWGAWRALLGSTGSRSTALLDDGEACACLDATIRLLRNGLANQVLCIRRPAAPKVAARPVPMTVPSIEGRLAILDFMIERLAATLRVPRSTLAPEARFADHGVDSIVGMTFAAEVGDALGVPLNGTVLYDYPSLDLLADYLGGRQQTPTAVHPGGNRGVHLAKLADDLRARFHAGELSADQVLQLLDRDLGGRNFAQL
jgi:polyketide synthase PksJ